MSDSDPTPPSNATQTALPDIATETLLSAAAPKTRGLDWVGMGQIEMPLSIALGAGALSCASARVDAFVNLSDPRARGIHMSRLYLHMDRSLAESAVSPPMLQSLLAGFLDSHAGLSTRARIALSFDALLRRPALASELSGWRAYPTRISASLDPAGFRVELALELLYSSTCPCSAALARQLIQQQFAADFAGAPQLSAAAVQVWLGTPQGIVATPHSQRSRLEVRLTLQPTSVAFPIVQLVNKLEGALQTPVQTAVKRIDEQAFARLNGQNLMFVEDAIRRVQSALQDTSEVLDFWAKASHLESLHAHDAVAIVVKGVSGGFCSEYDYARIASSAR